MSKVSWMPLLVAVLAIAMSAAFASAPIGATAGRPDEQRRVHRDLLIAAAASLSTLAPSLAHAFHDQTGIDVRFNFAGSNTLARQIIEGARADAFVSADEAQMDAVEQAGRVVPGTRVDVIGNQLVIIAPAHADAEIAQPDDLLKPGVRRIAMGDPSAVPAGVYGRRWLENLRLWTGVAPKIVPLPSSPAALAAVREGRANAGIVYATDARSGGVRVVHVVSPDDAPRIVYPAAVITRGRELEGRRFVSFLQSPTAAKIFEAAGFRALGKR
jgi:molybdate transport system substrate-binding protein